MQPQKPHRLSETLGLRNILGLQKQIKQFSSERSLAVQFRQGIQQIGLISHFHSNNGLALQMKTKCPTFSMSKAMVRFGRSTQPTFESIETGSQ